MHTPFQLISHSSLIIQIAVLLKIQAIMQSFDRLNIEILDFVWNQIVLYKLAQAIETIFEHFNSISRFTTNLDIVPYFCV